MFESNKLLNDSLFTIHNVQTLGGLGNALAVEVIDRCVAVVNLHTAYAVRRAFLHLHDVLELVPSGCRLVFLLTVNSNSFLMSSVCLIRFGSKNVKGEVEKILNMTGFNKLFYII